MTAAALPRLVGARYVVPLREGGSLPAVVDTAGDGIFVEDDARDMAVDEVREDVAADDEVDQIRVAARMNAASASFSPTIPRIASFARPESRLVCPRNARNVRARSL